MGTRMARKVRDNNGSYSVQVEPIIKYNKLCDRAVELELIGPVVGWGPWKWAVRATIHEMCSKTVLTYFVSGKTKPKTFKLGG